MKWLFSTLRKAARNLQGKIILYYCCFCLTYRVILWRTFFAWYIVKWKAITLYISPLLTPEEKCDTLRRSKNSLFQEILIWKTLKPVITLWLSPGKIEQHRLGLKLFICPAELFWPNILQLCLELDLLHNFSNHSTGFSLIEYFIDVNIQWYQDEISPLDLNTKAMIWWLRKIKTAGQEELQKFKQFSKGKHNTIKSVHWSSAHWLD